MWRLKGDPRRKNYFIDKKFQTQFILKFCLIIIAATLLAGALTYYLTGQSTTVAFDNLRIEVKTTADFILPVIMWIFLIVTLVAAFVTILVTLFTSHRIAGPLYRIKIELGRMMNGDLSNPIKLRTKDQLKIIAEECEQLRKVLARSLSEIKTDWGELKRDLESCEEKENGGNRKRKIDALELELDKFRTK